MLNNNRPGHEGHGQPRDPFVPHNDEMLTTHLSFTETLTLLSLTVACCGILANTFSGDADGEPLIASLAFSGLAFTISFCLIRWLGPTFMKAGLKGKDLSKTRTSEM